MTDPSLFDYILPEHLIAAVPAGRREDARLLCLDGTRGRIVHRERFAGIKQDLLPGDLLVLNDARVFPARLICRRKTGGKVEMLLVRPAEGDCTRPPESAARWLAVLKPYSRIKRGELLLTEGSEACISVDQRLGGGYVTISCQGPASMSDIVRAAHMPLPPYIRKVRRKGGMPEEMPELDGDRYQTVYADRSGAVAAPTAGLHFTEALLKDLKESGVLIRRLTLLVGPGTFMPVRAGRIEDHTIEPEFYHLPGDTAAAVQDALTEKRRIVATGTTCVRVLEHVARTGDWNEHSGWTGIYIYPPFEFKAVSALITNFHLPRSTLLMLVSAFAGRENILAAYREAVDREYRFYSYGDATFLY